MSYAHALNLIECSETSPADTQGLINSVHYEWITNFSLTSYNIDLLPNQAGCLRWKIENEAFNIQKNSELNLEHAYSLSPNASKVFYLLHQLARIIFQLIEKGSLLQEVFPTGWNSAKNPAFPLLEAWHNLNISAAELLCLAEGKFQVRFNSSCSPGNVSGQSDWLCLLEFAAPACSSALSSTGTLVSMHLLSVFFNSGGRFYYAAFFMVWNPVPLLLPI